MLGVVILGHEDRARRRLRVVEWVRAHPCCECRPVLVAKAPLEEFRRLCLAIELGGEPTIKGIAVVDPLLSCQGGKPFRSNPKSTCVGVLLRTVSSPFCCLITAPCCSHRDQSEYRRLDNFNHFQRELRSIIALCHLY